MKIYTCSQARQNLSEVVNRSKSEPVLIRQRGGEVSQIVPQVRSREGSPFEVEGISTAVTTADILSAIREGRERA